MTHRHQYAESLDEWRDLHGEAADEHAAPEPDRCPTHGHPLGLTGDCRACDQHTADRIRRDGGYGGWRQASDRADRLDAAWDARDNDTDY